MRTVFVNGAIFDGKRFHEDKALTIENGTITSFEELVNRDEQDTYYDLDGGLLAPGFIDTQINGGGGVMFNDNPSVDTLQTMIDSHRQFGTTSIFPTLISTDFSTMCKAATAVKDAISSNIAGIRGIHFEGPYLSTTKKGVHNEQIIRNVDNDALKLFSQSGLGEVLVTLAPEKVSPTFIQDLVQAGIRVCAGHTNATFKQMNEAFSNGVRGITHLFNAMSQFDSRAPGVVGAALEHKESWCGIIVDGYHVHPSTLRTAIKAKPHGKMILVTDAMATVGAANKSFILNDEEIIAIEGRCATSEGRLAGSDLDMASAVKNSVDLLKIPLEEALRMASLYPAEFVGLSDRLGQIKVGYQADLVHLNKELLPIRSWIGGR